MKPNLLFVCEANAQRSPTFFNWFKINRPNKYNVRSAGISWGYPFQLKPSQIDDTLEWADRVFVMDLSQERWISEKYPEYIDKVETIGISDQYARNSPQLCNLIQYWVDKRGL